MRDEDVDIATRSSTAPERATNVDCVFRVGLFDFFDDQGLKDVQKLKEGDSSDADRVNLPPFGPFPREVSASQSPQHALKR